MKRERDVGGHGGLGDRRYERYCAAFDWVEHCVKAGYFLEAIAVLESIIWDRLSSRLAYRWKESGLNKKPISTNTSSTKLCIDLIGGPGNGGCEHDPEFREAICKIKDWLPSRNDALHAIAKVSRDDTIRRGLQGDLEFAQANCCCWHGLPSSFRLARHERSKESRQASCEFSKCISSESARRITPFHVARQDGTGGF